VALYKIHILQSPLSVTTHGDVDSERANNIGFVASRESSISASTSLPEMQPFVIVYWSSSDCSFMGSQKAIQYQNPQIGKKNAADVVVISHKVEAGQRFLFCRQKYYPGCISLFSNCEKRQRQGGDG